MKALIQLLVLSFIWSVRVIVITTLLMLALIGPLLLVSAQDGTATPTLEPALTPIPNAEDVSAQEETGVFSLLEFLENITNAINTAIAGSAVASGILVLAIVDFVKKLPLPINDSANPAYIDGPTLQKWIGGAVVVIFWIAPIVGASELVQDGYNFLTLIIPLLIQMLTILAGAFGISWAAHRALVQTAVPFFGRSSARN